MCSHVHMYIVFHFEGAHSIVSVCADTNTCVYCVREAD
jgi:hypothetical protein